MTKRDMRLGNRVFVRLCCGVAAMVGTGMVTACALAPAQGPTTGEVAAQANRSHYELIAVDARVAALTRRPTVPDLVRRFGEQRPRPAGLLGPGDVIQITVWESSQSGLFTGEGRRNASFDNLVIDDSGYVFLPYAGRIRISGLSVEQARQAIQTRLEKETMRPQIELRMVADRTDRTTISGAVKRPQTIRLSHAHETNTLLDLISEAGGSTVGSHRSEVTLLRGGQSGTIMLDTLYQHPDYDVRLAPGDRVVVNDRPFRFSILGAVSKKGQYEFTKGDFMLIDALSLAGGLEERSAEPTGVFLLRFEDTSIVNEIRQGRDRPPLDGERIPTVYQLNMREARAFFHAQRLGMRDQDVIYVTTAPLHQWQKVLQPISQSVFLARTGLGVF